MKFLTYFYVYKPNRTTEKEMIKKELKKVEIDSFSLFFIKRASFQDQVRPSIAILRTVGIKLMTFFTSK